LCSAWVAFHGLIAHPCELSLHRKTALRQHAHGAQRDRDKADTQAEQSAIALTQMFTGTVMDRPPTVRQAERGIDRNKYGLSLPYKVQDLIIAERHVRFSAQIAQHTQPSPPPRRPSEIDSYHDLGCALGHRRLLAGRIVAGRGV
jgi:hypothetical protein